MTAVVTVVGAPAVGEPAPADPFMPLAADGVKDGCPPVIDDKQEHADQIFEKTPADIDRSEDHGPKASVALPLSSQLYMFTSAFRTSRIHSHSLLSYEFNIAEMTLRDKRKRREKRPPPEKKRVKNHRAADII